MDYPAHSLYEVLYARYLKPGRTEELLKLCGDLRDARVLDLCGGGGRAATLALEMGARAVTLVDESSPMSAHLSQIPGISLVQRDVATYLQSFAMEAAFDAVICQQAVTYWFCAELMTDLRHCMKPGARFVFNTFWDEPARFPIPKQYEYAGRQYLELSWRSDEKTIEHVQVCEGHAPHTTRFQWVSPEEFHRALEPWFSVEELRDGKTSVYVCTAR